MASNTLLFFDDEWLNVRTNTVRRQGQAKRIDRSVFHETAGNCGWGYPGVWKDPDTGKWGLVYAAGIENKSGSGTILLAESDDGLSWKPVDTTDWLNIPNRKAVNQIIPYDGYAMLCGFFVDPVAPPSARYKILALTQPASKPHVYISGDGRKWSELPGADWQNPAPDPPTFVHWNAIRQSYVFTSRPGHADRRIGVYETRDWKKFSPMELAMYADSQDQPLTQIYGMHVFPYEGIYIGLLWLYDCQVKDYSLQPLPHLYKGGRLNCQLAYSLNGWHWQRSLRQPFISNGKPDEPDAGTTQVASCVPLPDGSLRFYAATTRSEHGYPEVPNDGYIIAYELRQDGFNFLESDGGVGMVGTRAMYWNFCDATLNIDSAAGLVRVQVTDAEHKPLPGYTFAESVPLKVDSTKAIPAWTSNKAMDQLGGKMIRFEIELTNARLYALRGDFIRCRLPEVKQFEKDKTIPVARPGF